MEKNKIETGLSSDAKKEPRRVVFVTKKTSAKVVGERGPQLMTFPHLLIREAIAFGCDYFSTTPKWLGISGIAGSVGSVGPSKCRAIKIAPGFRSIGACQLLLGQVRKRRSRQSFHPPEKQPQLTILADGVSIERRHFRVEL